MKIRECKICGKKFESHNGIEVCSNDCRLERKRRQDKKSNERRKNGESNLPIIYTCQVCGKQFEGLAQKYCSDECRLIARNRQVKENNKIHYNENKNIND